MADNLESIFDTVWSDLSETAFETKQLFDTDPNKLNPGKTRMVPQKMMQQQKQAPQQQQQANKAKPDSIERVDTQCASFYPPPQMVANYMANPNPAVNPVNGLPYYVAPPGWCIMPSVAGYPYGYPTHFQPIQQGPQQMILQPPAAQRVVNPNPQYGQPVPHSIGQMVINRPDISAVNNQQAALQQASSGANYHFLPLHQKQNMQVATDSKPDFWKETAVCVSVGVLTLIALDLLTQAKKM
uniref:Transmembrane protein n=1 Tax=Clandestinovirus TaxID=2831644 RepID=A0A8F8KR66_9VIRU|nr:transmembrane protein [Clandestinovirus]